jgi:hypothetical protein
MLIEMASSPNDPNKVKYIKYLSWLFMLAILSIFLSGRIQFWMPEYSHMDLAKYKTMAETSPQISETVIQPFVYRVFAPWFAGLLPFKTEISFYLLTTLSLFLVVYLLFGFLIINGIEYRIAFALTSCFIFNRYFFQFLAWDYFHLTDTLSLIVILIFLINLKNRNWFYLLAISILGVLIKETVLIMIPVAYIFLFQFKAGLKEYIGLTIISVVTFLIFIGIRLTINVTGGENLWTQFFTGLEYFFTAESLLKKLVVAFLPFGLVPFIFYGESLQFFKSNYHYQVLFVLVFIISFFGDAERLMMPLAPVYYVLIGYIMQKHITEKINKSYLRKFLVYLMILSFLSSFYHLWGIFKLPSGVYSLITSSIITLFSGYLFLRLKSIKNIQSA